MNSFTLPSFAKINLQLRVLGKREDGFHELFTVFQTVSLHDKISFSEGDKIELTCSSNRIPTDDKNLIVRAARILKERSGHSSGAKLHLSKRIPSPGGLGGGSSNAAVALIGLLKLWDVRLADGELNQIASSLGADVPFFLHGGTAVGTGRGDKIEPVTDIDEKNLLIVTPKVRVSTAKAFARLNARSLTTSDSNRILNVCRFDARSIDLRRSVLVNDIEAAVFEAYPEVGRVKKTLLDLGAANALMSGSGASVFAVFEKKETRQTAIKALDNEVNWRKFAVAAVSRDEYREKLGIRW